MNLFGNLGQKRRNPLAGLMQPNLMEMLKGGDIPIGTDEEVIPSEFRGQHPDLPGLARTPMNTRKMTRDEAILGGQAPVTLAASQQKKEVQTPRDNSALGALLGGPAAERFIRSQGGIVGGHGKPNPTETILDYVLPRDIAGVNAPGHVPGTGDPKGPPVPASSPGTEEGPSPGTEEEHGFGQDPMLSDEKEKNLDLGMGGGMVGQALGATQELLQKYAGAAQSMEAAKLALKKEFEGTPELDQVIASTQAELSQTKAGRKQPGIGEFLTMALLNLSGMNPRQSADMVLGLGDQERREGRLEDRLAQLEGSRAGAKMSGRRESRVLQQQDRYKQLEASLRQQESGRKQGNENRDFALRQQGQTNSLLRALAGQEAQVLGGMGDDATKKKAAESRARLKKALGLDDAGLDRELQRQQQQAAPQDERQSRMFGDFLGGGGYA